LCGTPLAGRRGSLGLARFPGDLHGGACNGATAAGGGYVVGIQLLGDIQIISVKHGKNMVRTW